MPDSVELDLAQTEINLDFERSTEVVLETVQAEVNLELDDGNEITLDIIQSEVSLELDTGNVVTLDVVNEDITLEVVGQVGPRGPQGIQGEVGPPGPPPVFYRHHQTSASDRWFVDHDLSYPPAVTVVDSAGTVLIADVVYIDDFHIQIDFSAPTAGYAYCT